MSLRTDEFFTGSSSAGTIRAAGHEPAIVRILLRHAIAARAEPAPHGRGFDQPRQGQRLLGVLELHCAIADRGIVALQRHVQSSPLTPRDRLSTSGNRTCPVRCSSSRSTSKVSASIQIRPRVRPGTVTRTQSSVHTTSGVSLDTLRKSMVSARAVVEARRARQREFVVVALLRQQHRQGVRSRRLSGSVHSRLVLAAEAGGRSPSSAAAAPTLRSATIRRPAGPRRAQLVDQPPGKRHRAEVGLAAAGNGRFPWTSRSARASRTPRRAR